MSILIAISFEIADGEENQKNLLSNLIPLVTIRAVINHETAMAPDHQYPSCP
jgi:hypothetical protein